MEINYQNVTQRFANLPFLEEDEREAFDGMSVAITGGAGSIGSRIAMNLLKHTKATVLILDNDESRMHSFYLQIDETLKNRCAFKLIDVRDMNSVRSTLYEKTIDLIIHTAALKHVPILELQPYEAYMTNVVGTHNILLATQEFSVKNFTFVSTDKAANPINHLGKTKLIGEYLTASFFQNSLRENLDQYYSCVRFGNVFLSRGSAIETFIYQIENGLPVTITSSEMERYFMDLGDAANLILKISANRIGNVSLLNMGDPIRILDIIERMHAILGKEISLKEIGIKPGEKLTEELYSSSDSELILSNGIYDVLRLKSRINLNNLDHDQVFDNPSANQAIDNILSNLLR